MLSAYCAALVACTLLAVPAAAVPPEAETWGPETRRIQLAPHAGTPPEVRISQGLSTVLVFDTAVARQELPGEERFGRVRLARETLVLMPGPGVKAGEAWTLIVHFADGAAPARAELRLVVDATLAERQVEVYRHPRSAEVLQAELLEKERQVQRCHAEVARLQAAQAQPDGLAGWFAIGLMTTDGVKVAAQKLVTHPRSALTVKTAHVYRVATRAAVELRPVLPGGKPWAAGEAALQAKTGPGPRVLRVWQSAPIAPGQNERLVVEVEAPAGMYPGPYTLTVEEAGGTRSFSVGNIMIR